MSIAIAPNALNAQNSPIEVGSNSTDDAQILRIGTSVDEKAYFEGIIYKRPSATITGVDVQPYVRNLPNTDGFVIGSTTFNTLLIDFVNDIKISFYKTNGTDKIADTTVKVCAQNPLYKDWYQFCRQDLPFGRFQHWLANERQNGDPIMYVPTEMPSDWILQSFVNSYCWSDMHVNGRVWNKALMGAPLYIQVFNGMSSNDALTYNIAKYVSKTGAIDEGIADATITINAGTVRSFFVNKYYPTEKLVSMAFRLEDMGATFRTIYIERIDPECLKGEPFQLYWQNRLGGVDWLPMGGKTYQSISAEKSSYERERRPFAGSAFSGTLARQVTRNYLSTSGREFNLNSDIMGDEHRWLEDLFVSPKVWLWSQTYGAIAVEVMETNFEHKNFKNNGIFNFTVRVKEQFNDLFIG